MVVKGSSISSDFIINNLGAHYKNATDEYQNIAVFEILLRLESRKRRAVGFLPPSALLSLIPLTNLFFDLILPVELPTARAGAMTWPSFFLIPFLIGLFVALSLKERNGTVSALWKVMTTVIPVASFILIAISIGWNYIAAAIIAALSGVAFISILVAMLSKTKAEIAGRKSEQYYNDIPGGITIGGMAAGFEDNFDQSASDDEDDPFDDGSEHFYDDGYYYHGPENDSGSTTKEDATVAYVRKLFEGYDDDAGKLKERYRTLIRMFHPDNWKDGDEIVGDMSKTINQVYDELKEKL